ncbi:MAG: TonB family protein [Crocinitomicaceae bacterium]|jgi:TonB family protein
MSIKAYVFISFLSLISYQSIGQDSTVIIGDSIVTYGVNGNLKNLEFKGKLREQRIQRKLPINIGYHDNGFISGYNYTFSHGAQHYIQYSDSKRGCPVSGANQFEANYTFEVCKMVRKESNKTGWGMSMEMPVMKSIPFCIEEGTFKNFVLSQGTIKYYSKDHKLITTVNVISGRRQNDPIVYFKDSLLEQAFTQNQIIDLNHNGRIEKSEASLVTEINIKNGKGLTSLTGLSHFNRLEKINVNGYRFKPSDYATDKLLLEAIHSTIHTVTPVPNPKPPIRPYPQPIQEAEIYDFPDNAAQFPSGAAEMQKWLIDNMVYPEIAIALEDEGRVYLSFVIETSGLISNIKVEKGISKEIDREAKRLIRSMPKWIPGMHEENLVRTRVLLPIVFTLE